MNLGLGRCLDLKKDFIGQCLVMEEGFAPGLDLELGLGLGLPDLDLELDYEPARQLRSWL